MPVIKIKIKNSVNEKARFLNIRNWENNLGHTLFIINPSVRIKRADSEKMINKIVPTASSKLMIISFKLIFNIYPPIRVIAEAVTIVEINKDGNKLLIIHENEKYCKSGKNKPLPNMK